MHFPFGIPLKLIYQAVAMTLTSRMGEYLCTFMKLIQNNLLKTYVPFRYILNSTTLTLTNLHFSF